MKCDIVIPVWNMRSLTEQCVESIVRHTRFPYRIVAVDNASDDETRLYLEGLAENWEVVIFIVGIVLIAVEIFAIPGFGVAGISGILLVITGLTLAMVDNLVFELDWNIAFAEVVKKFFIVITAMFLSFILSLYLGQKLFTAKAFAGLALDSQLDVKNGFLGVESQPGDLVGKSGVSDSILRPSGKVVIDDEIYDAISEYGFIEKGEKVRVIKYEGGQIHVVKE